MRNQTKRDTYIGMMLALSAVLSFVPIPGFPTTALDAIPGYVTAIYVNPILGGIIALVGHLLTAFFHGTPLGIPAHLIIALSMFIAAFAFGKVFKDRTPVRIVLAILIATVCNIYLSMPFLAWFLKIPWAFLFTLQIPLLVASLVNIILAYMVYHFIKVIPFDK